ncbi:MAG: hypothetical protein ACRDKC_05140 [Gaiellaceae bacterium]
MTFALPPWVDPWCRAHLGAALVEPLFVVSHVSEVVGVRLAGGREVVVKRRPDEAGRAQVCVSAQRLVAEQGFPCPLPLTEVVVADGLAVHAERLVEGGELETENTPEAAARSAALLADLVRRLAAFDLRPPLPNPEWVRWESLPDRQSASPEPEWVDETQRRVRAKLAGGELPGALGHVDWEAQNMRWRGREPVAVHDWDSLAWLPEATIVGTAAGVFASHGNPTLAPLESSAAFLDAYQQARGVRLSPYEEEIAWAASLWVALHNARDELIFDRPRLSFDTLEQQRAERLARARA